MAVHFAYRSHYDNPGCFYRRRFEADSLLAWFQSIWQPIRADDAGEHADELLGTHVYSFGNLFEKIDDEEWPVPKSMKELTERLNDALYIGEMKGGQNHIQILTDDDELEMAVYFFDDEYVAKHPDRAAFLMGDGWQLPDGGKHGEFKPPPGVPKVHPKAVAGEGRTYFASFAYFDSGSLTDLDPGELTGVIPGVRVHDLPRVLLALDAEFGDSGDVMYPLRDLLGGIAPAARMAKGTEIPLLKAVRANPNDTACWAAYCDWLEENGKPTLLERILAKYRAADEHTGDRVHQKKDRVLVQSHVAQACKRVARWVQGHRHQDMYHHLILFDDLWANAHPLLASSILRAGNRWDVL
jgi:uncharacterized protein (TIGR02996 family)